MRNIIEERPTDDLHGRALYNTRFVDDADIEGKSLLDIGCGFGWFELDALSRGCTEIMGMEISEKDLQTAKKYIHDPRVSFKIGSAVKLPFDDDVFNTVFAWEVLEHIPAGKEEKMFTEVRRVLKKGGVFYLSTPFDSWMSKIFDPAWWLIGHRHYSKERLLDIITKSGFIVDDVIVKGGMWEMVGINDLYIAKWIFHRRPFFEDLINKKQNKEYAAAKGFTNIFLKIRRVD